MGKVRANHPLMKEVIISTVSEEFADELEMDGLNT